MMITEFNYENDVELVFGKGLMTSSCQSISQIFHKQYQRFEVNHLKKVFIDFILLEDPSL